MPTTSCPPTLHLLLAPGGLPPFTSLLQSGFEVPCFSAESLGSFLNRLPGFTSDYITERIQTIFVNGLPTDDMQTVLHGNPPVVALSAAMPGLAGAILRKNSFHKALRSTPPEKNDTAASGQSAVRLKLFNAIARERGPELLAQGVLLAARQLADFLAGRPELWPQLHGIRLAERSLTARELMAALPDIQRLQVQVTEDHAR